MNMQCVMFLLQALPFESYHIAKEHGSTSFTKDFLLA